MRILKNNHIDGIKKIFYNKVKKCDRCFKEKPLSEFQKDKSRSSGYRAECKECRKNNVKRPINWKYNIGTL